MTTVNTKTAERRDLHFDTLEDLRADVERVIAAEKNGTLRRTGNWSMGQIFQHMGGFIVNTLDGFPPGGPPWLVKKAAQLLFKKGATKKPPPAGFKIPKGASFLLPDDDVSDEKGAEVLLTAIGRLTSGERCTHDSPLFGHFTPEEWIQLHLRHGELHLSFLHPEERMAELTYHSMSAGDRKVIPTILGYAFGHDEAGAIEWLNRHDDDDVRVVRDGDRAVAVAVLIRMGQHIRGRSVPMVGIAAVATAPEARGGGAATLLMRSLVEELGESRAPLSTLYPATQPLYRRAGYEQAGCYFEISIDTADLSVPMTTEPAIRRATDDDLAGIRDCYAATAIHENGSLDRNELMWSRVTTPRHDKAEGFVIEVAGNIDAYVFMTRVPIPGRMSAHQMRITGMGARTPEATMRLLAFLTTHASMVPRMSWHSSPNDPMLTLLREATYTVRLHDHWMARITDVEAALMARGYPPAMNAEVTLRVSDDLIAANNGDFHLRIDNGAPAVSRSGGANPLELDIRALASLYTGFASAHALVSSGRASGDSEAAALATAVFDAPLPCMSEMF